MKESQRKYTGVLQYFHNYEHNSDGRRHCTGPQSNPYRIAHLNKKHIITHKYAVGHGKKCKRQWFRFPRRLAFGYDMSHYVKVDEPDNSLKVEKRDLTKIYKAIPKNARYKK